MLNVPSSHRYTAQEERDKVVSALSDISKMVIEELQRGSIAGITVLNADAIKEYMCVAGGGRCEIYKASLHNNKVVAIKLFREQYAMDALQCHERKDRLYKYFIRECGTWKNVDEHPNIVSLIGFVQGFGLSTLPGLISEYYEHGNLRSFVRRASPSVPERTRIKLLADASSGIEYLHHHDRKVLHRDIKGKNIYVRTENGNLVAAIGDFGTAKLEDSNIFAIAKTTARNSLAWTPPEYVLKGGIVDYSTPTTEGDIWSLGCTILEILTGRDPWPNDEDIKSRLIAEQHPPKPLSETINHELWELITWCWVVNPKLRKPVWIIKTSLQRYLETGSIFDRKYN